MNLSEQINNIERLLENNSEHLPEEIYKIYGLTSRTSQTFLNNICTDKKVLEIGTFYGASTFAMGYNNNSDILTIDNWKDIENIPVNNLFYEKMIFSDKDHFLKKLNAFNNINYLEGDIFSKEIYNKLSSKKFDIIFYDGPHEIEDIIRFIMLYDILFKDCIVIFDDYNFETVRLGIDFALKETNTICKYKKEIITKGESKDTFWNGMGIFIF